MSNVIHFQPARQAPKINPITALIGGFAQGRRLFDDVFWLKENAELLGILRAQGITLDPGALAPFADFYAQIEARIRFFPQYYRFLLSLCLDLEDLGMEGTKGAALCEWVALEGLAEAELSDLQRAEARRLIARRGVLTPQDGALDQRLHGFINRNVTFSLPNKKAAYELTHIVFYLSEYGQRNPKLSDAAMVSLEYAGLLAYLDQNADLLAEVCTAMRFAGAQPSPLWDALVAQQHSSIQISAEPDSPLNDGYHAYLVTGWAMKVAGHDAFAHNVPEGPIRFSPPHVAQKGALRMLSECMYDLGVLRSGDWEKMRGHVLPYLGSEGQQVLRRAEESSERFDGFFEGFARAM